MPMTEPKRTSTAKAGLKWLGCYVLFMLWLWVTATIFSWGLKQSFTQYVMYFCGWEFGSAIALIFYVERHPRKD